LRRWSTASAADDGVAASLTDVVRGLRHAASRARRAVYATYDDVVLLKVLDPAVPPADGRPLRVETAEQRHVPQMAKLVSEHAGGDVTDLYAERMASGAGAVVGLLGDEPIGFVWWADAEVLRRVEPLLHIQYGVRLAPRDVYELDLFVAPEHRGQGTSTWFLAAAEAEIKRLGYDRMWGYAHTGNRPARWLFAISGHQVVRRLETEVLLSRLLRIDGSLYLASAGRFRRIR
jgi:GNAT superfamily N-acetyltransferase